MENLDYATRLSRLKLFSLERRRDRFRVIYVWRIINGLSPNLDNEHFKIRTCQSTRRGLICVIPSLTRSAGRLQTTIEESFAVVGPKVFNSIDKNLRCYTGNLETFKARLDRFLCEIPDRPVLLGQQQVTNCNRLDIRVLEHRRHPMNNPP